MRTETIEIFNYDELGDAAKAKARDGWRDGALNYDWFDYIYSDADNIAQIIGIKFGVKHVEIMNGTTRSEPKIWFSGFACQGDGACFDGSYSYAKGAAKAIRKYAPQDDELHRIADELQALQKRFFYRLEAQCSHTGRYYHSGCMSVCVGQVDCGFHDVDSDTDSELTDLMRRFADWIFGQLESEYEHLMSDENAAESIRCNEYEFHADGSLV